MKDSTLLKFALLIGILGVIGLFFLSKNVVVPSKIKLTPNDEIIIQGKIVKKQSKENIEILKVEEIRVIDVVIFDSSKFMVGDYINVHGVVDEYNGKEQIIADYITQK